MRDASPSRAAPVPVLVHGLHALCWLRAGCPASASSSITMPARPAPPPHPPASRAISKTPDGSSMRSARRVPRSRRERNCIHRTYRSAAARHGEFAEGRESGQRRDVRRHSTDTTHARRGRSAGRSRCGARQRALRAPRSRALAPRRPQRSRVEPHPSTLSLSVSRLSANATPGRGTGTYSIIQIKFRLQTSSQKTGSALLRARHTDETSCSLTCAPCTTYMFSNSQQLSDAPPIKGG